MGFLDEFRYRDECPHCRVKNITMAVLAQENQTVTGLGHPRTWTTIACTRCGGAVLIETNSRGNSPDRELLVLPVPGDVGVDVKALPSDVQQLFQEAQIVRAAGVPSLLAVALGKTIEAAAKSVGVERPFPLVKAIDDLVSDGKITQAFSEALTHVRSLRNAGAHGSVEGAVTDEDAERAFRFTAAFLRDLFEIPAELAAMEAGEPPPADSAPE